MTFVDVVFFFYSFVAIYMLSLMVITYLSNRKEMFDHPSGKPEPVSIIIPCYNEGRTIGRVIESIFQMDYPKDMIEIIIVDDFSQDNSVEMIRPYTKKYKNVKLIALPENSGGPAKPTNTGIKAAKYDYILAMDSDSFPKKDALKKMIGYLQEDKEIGGVTCSILVNKPNTFAQRIQHIEYIVIAFARKLLDFIDAVYVTPGPFALYRKEVLFEIGLFEEGNLTQDIEIVWRMMAHGYKARMVLPARVYVDSPRRFKAWWNQRVRWNVGGTQTLWKYRKWSLRNNMLGLFVIPFFTMSMFLGILGLGLFIYLGIKRLFLFLLSSSYSVGAQASIIQFSDFSLNLSILNFFGIALFVLGTTYSLFGIWAMKEVPLKKLKIFNLTFFLSLYLMIYPLIMIAALWRMARGNYSWGRAMGKNMRGINE